jgi:hypothetical protein
MGQAHLGKKQDPYVQNNQSKKGWRCVSNSRALTLKLKALRSNCSTAKKNFEAIFLGQVL